MDTEEKRFQVQEDIRRLDLYLSGELQELSRTQIARYIADGSVSVNGKPAKASRALKAGDRVSLILEEKERKPELEARDLPLHIIYEDDELLVVNKSRGMVVHPAPGHHDDTLVNAVLHHCGSSLSSIGGEGRPGIVHRIDQDTSGLLLVCKTDCLHRALSEMISRHEVRRSYMALVWGQPETAEGTIDAPIGRDPRHRQQMAVVSGGRSAISHFELIQRFKRSSELSLSLETGRTHQLRVHLLYIGHPIIADPLYARKRENFGMSGQALHAWKLSFRDPRDGALRIFTCEPPEDYLELRRILSME